MMKSQTVMRKVVRLKSDVIMVNVGEVKATETCRRTKAESGTTTALVFPSFSAHENCFKNDRPTHCVSAISSFFFVSSFA